MPKSLKEERRHTIRAGCFGGVHLEKGSPNFLLCVWPNQVACHFSHDYPVYGGQHIIHVEVVRGNEQSLIIFLSYACYLHCVRTSPPTCISQALDSILARWWKNVVFLSPVESQMERERWCQNTSSWCISSFISFLTSCILSKFSLYPAVISSSNSPCLALIQS